MLRNDQGFCENACMTFNPGFDIRVTDRPLGFRYGSDVFGPEPESRRLEAIRHSLLDPQCDGPDPAYVIAMDVGRESHRQELLRRQLLYGVVAFAEGRLGREPVRSQGHVHRVSEHSGWRPPELYEIWSGRACIYMQEDAAADPGRCFAVIAEIGDVVLVPPGWAHATVSADPANRLVFGAWCDRDYGFEYHAVRSYGGLAWFPILNSHSGLDWLPNPRYVQRELIVKDPRPYTEFGLEPGVPIYKQFERNADAIQWVSFPGLKRDLWQQFVP
jgi:glucose-6-phosphate isomerase